MNDYDELSSSVNALAVGLQALHRLAVEQLTPLVEGILRSRSRDVRHIEHTLDRLLDHCCYEPALMPVEVSRRWHAQRADWLQRHGISMGNRNWREQLNRLDVALRREFHETFSRQYLETLDKGLGACVLRRPELSKIVADALLHFDGDRYHMGDFVVMPNHVHAIVCLLGETEIEAQCTSWKRFAAKKINQLLKARGRFWQEESFDHLIRSPEQFEAIQRYIAKNPSHLKAGEFYLYQRPVAGTLRVPSAASSTKSEAASTTGHGTWNVPATLEDRP